MLQHLDISNAANSFVDVPEWASRASKTMSAMGLAERMARCELQVLGGIVLPLATGNIKLVPSTPA